MGALVFGHTTQKATKKALLEHSVVLQKCSVPILTWTKFTRFRRTTRITAKSRGQVGKPDLLFSSDPAKRGRGVWLGKAVRNSPILPRNVPLLLIIWLVHIFWDFPWFKFTFGDSSEITVVMWDWSCLILLATYLQSQSNMLIRIHQLLKLWAQHCKLVFMSLAVGFHLLKL